VGPIVHNLDCLVEPFSKEEIEGIVKHLKTDKAPGPDSFNGLFMNKCWHIIKEDFLQLCKDFYNGITS
jgi:hypothetical protein